MSYFNAPVVLVGSGVGTPGGRIKHQFMTSLYHAGYRWLLYIVVLKLTDYSFKLLLGIVLSTSNREVYGHA